MAALKGLEKTLMRCCERGGDGGINLAEYVGLQGGSQTRLGSIVVQDSKRG